MPLRPVDWLDGAAYHMEPREDAPEAPHVRLSELDRSQKRELAGFAVAAATTCAFLLTPLMVTGAGDRELPATALAIQFAPAPVITEASAVAPALRSARARPSRSARTTSRSAQRGVITASRPLPASAPLLASAEVRSGVLGTARGPAQADRSASARAPRGLARVLFGSGRHRVRPFPVPSDQN